MAYKAPKLNEITYERFEALMEEHHHELLEKGAKIAAKVIKEIYDKKGNFGVANAMNMAKNAINSQLAYENAKTQSGLLFGGRDKFGSKMKAQFALLMPGGKTLSVTNWTKMTNDLMGNKVTIPDLAAVTAKITWETGDYPQWTLLALNEIKPMSKDPELVLKTLEQLGIKEVADLPQIPKPTGTYPIVCFRARIRTVRTSTPYGENEARPICVKNSSGKGHSLVASIATEVENGVQCWIYCEPRNEISLLTMIEDIDEMLKGATETTENPVEQAAYMDGMLSGKDIVVIGSLSSVKQADGKYADYTANVAAFAIIEIPQDLGIKVTPIPEPQTTFAPTMPEEDKKKFTETDEETSARVKEFNKEKTEEEKTKPTAEEKPAKRKYTRKKKTTEEAPVEEKKEPAQETAPKTEQPEVVTEILELLFEKADILGFATLAGINIDQMAKSRDFKKFNEEIVKQVWADHMNDNVEEWNKK